MRHNLIKELKILAKNKAFLEKKRQWLAISLITERRPDKRSAIRHCCRMAAQAPYQAYTRCKLLRFCYIRYITASG
ncbi:hypothetical protein AL515_22575 [Citrobacter sp. FDAARGOS_156]|nr:hypothetical protein AL515_22575 [Citrobacter sp. FDAARGOS_156]